MYVDNCDQIIVKGKAISAFNKVWHHEHIGESGFL